VRDQRHASAVVPPGKGPGTHFTVGWVAPGPVFIVAEYLTSTGIRSPELQLVVSHCTETSTLEFEKWNEITQDVVDEIKQTKKIRPFDLNWVSEPYTV
jgi:hypothetical protein